MSSPVSRGEIVTALLKKEFVAYSRDKLYLFLTLLTLVAVVSIFWIIPDSVDESITLAVTPPVQTVLDDGAEALRAMGATDEQLAEIRDADLSEAEEGLELVEFESAEDMAAVIEGRLEAWRTEAGELVLRDRAADEKPADAGKLSVGLGLALGDGFIGDVAAQRKGVTVTVYSDAGVPDEIRGAMTSFVREAAYQLAGRQLPVEMPDEETIVLGTDRVGDQVSMREKLIPMLAFMILLMETFSMASLISVEVLQRTVSAVLVTPARIGDVLAAKSIFGTGMALFQGLLVLGLIGAFTASNWWLLLITMFIGAMMFTGVAMIVGSAGKDFMGQLFYSMMLTIPLIIPAVSVLFPGSAATWVKLIPTFPVLDALVNISIYEAAWPDVWRSFALGAGWVVVLFGLGMVALKRKVESL
ncbi:MAG: ABC transporter permease [Coriobacteriia bacterium]|nr:ABC transporter permease [Coriobacteriia bacterium]